MVNCVISDYDDIATRGDKLRLWGGVENDTSGTIHIYLKFRLRHQDTGDEVWSSEYGPYAVPAYSSMSPVKMELTVPSNFPLGASKGDLLLKATHATGISACSRQLFGAVSIRGVPKVKLSDPYGEKIAPGYNYAGDVKVYNDTNPNGRCTWTVSILLNEWAVSSSSKTMSASWGSYDEERFRVEVPTSANPGETSDVTVGINDDHYVCGRGYKIFGDRVEVMNGNPKITDIKIVDENGNEYTPPVELPPYAMFWVKVKLRNDGGYSEQRAEIYEGTSRILTSDSDHVEYGDYVIVEAGPKTIEYDDLHLTAKAVWYNKKTGSWESTDSVDFDVLVSKEGEARLFTSTISYPQYANAGDTVTITVDVKNIGTGDDNIKVDLIDNDTSAVLDSQIKFIQSMKTESFELQTTMPNRDLNFVIAASHEE